MLKKQLYSAPEAELLVVRFEENLLGTQWTKNQAGDIGDENEEYTYDF